MPKRRRSHIFEKAKHGHYVEPSWVSERLFEVERFGPLIYDPACGWGTITKAAINVGYKAQGSDIVDRKRHHLGSAFVKNDFLRNGRPFTFTEFSIVCNPPFDHVEEFCRVACKSGATKVAMICLTRRLNAAHWLRELPLSRVYLLTPRPSMPPGSYLRAGKAAGGGTQDFCWLVFEPKRSGFPTPELFWLHRDAQATASRSFLNSSRRVRHSTNAESLATSSK
jgi:hypothetical protein